MRVFQRCLPVIIWALVSGNTIAAEAKNNKPMQGVPPTRDSQVTMKNYRDYPANRWAFRNTGPPVTLVTALGVSRAFALGSFAFSVHRQCHCCDCSVWCY